MPPELDQQGCVPYVNKEVSRMKWEPRKVYLYLVSLVTFIMVLIGTWQLVDTLVEMALPTNDAMPCHMVREPMPDERPKPAPDCQEERRRHEENQRIWRMRRLAQNGLFLVVVVPAYLYHWRQARKLEE